MARQYIVRTIFIANFGNAVKAVARLRRNPTDAESLRVALKRLELADKALEDELNANVERGYDLVEIIQHTLEEQPSDLMVTTIFAKDD